MRGERSQQKMRICKGRGKCKGRGNTHRTCHMVLLRERSRLLWLLFHRHATSDGPGVLGRISRACFVRKCNGLQQQLQQCM